MRPIYISALLLTILCICACNQKMDLSELNIQYQDRLVVEGLITTEKKEHQIILSHSCELSDMNTLRMESGATVSVADSNSMEILTEKRPGIYVTNPYFSGSVNKTYTLNILLKNGETYSASCFLFQAMVADTMYSIRSGNEYGICLKAHSLNPQGAACITDMYVNDSLMTSHIKNKKIYAMGGFHRQMFTLSEQQLTKDTTKVTVKMYSTPYQMYEYLKDIKNETIFGTEIFRTAASDVRTNISNNGLGFFLASDVWDKSITIVKTKQ